MDELFSKIDKLKNLINLNKDNYQKLRKRHYRMPRPSAVKNINNILKEKQYYFNQHLIIENESSDSNSMIEAQINNDITLKLPTLTKISRTIFDKNTIMIIDNINNFPKEAIDKNGIGFLLVGIEEWVSEKNILYFLEHIPNFQKVKINTNYTYDNFLQNKIHINYINFFYLGKRFCAFVNIQSLEHIKILGEFFFHPLKQIHPTFNSKGDKIEFYYAYNLLTLTKSFWYAVIIRNLPLDCNDKSIFQFCKYRINDGIKYCLNPVCINENYCSLAVCSELKYAEILCDKLNNYILPNKKILKANLHPSTCKIRRNIENNNQNKFFSQNDYLYEENIENSENCFKNSKSCISLLSDKKIDNINNEKKIIGNKSEAKTKEETDKNNMFNNINDNNTKKKKKIKKSSLNILKSFKKALDLKFNKNIFNVNKNEAKNNSNLNESNNADNNNNQYFLLSNNTKLNNQTNDIINIENKNDSNLQENNKKNKEIIFENKSSKDEIEYYTYNFPDKSFFENLEKEEEKNDFYFQNSNINNKSLQISENSFNFNESKSNSHTRNYENILSKDYFIENKSLYSYQEEDYNLVNKFSKEKYYNNTFSDSFNYSNSYYKQNESFDYCDNENIYDMDKEYYFKIKEENKSYLNSSIENKKNEKEIESFNKEYNNLKRDIIRNVNDIKMKIDDKSINLNKIKKFMKKNKIIKKIIMEEIKNNSAYIKHMEKDDYLIMNRELSFKQLEKIINNIKIKIEKKYNKNIFI